MSIPIDPDTGNPYFTISRDGWGTGWSAGPTRVIPGPIEFSFPARRIIRVISGRRPISRKKFRQQLKRAHVRFVFGAARALVEGRDFIVDFDRGAVSLLDGRGK